MYSPTSKSAIVSHNYAVTLKSGEHINLSSIIKSKELLKKTNPNPISNSNKEIINYKIIMNKKNGVDGIITGLKKGTTILKFAKEGCTNQKNIQSPCYEVKITVK